MNSEIELAKDQLWKFQLRREHAQLLKDMDSHKEAFTAFAEEARVAQEGLKEQLTGLKSRFEKLADDSKKQAQEAKDHRRAIDGKVAEIDRIKADLMALGVHVNTIEGKQSTLVEPTVPANPLPTTKVHEAAVAKASKASLILSGSPESAVIVTPKPAHSVATTGFRKSRRQARQEPSPLAPRTYAKLPDPPLSQDGASVTNYFLASNAISTTINPEHQTPLAAMFITGLAEREDQDAVVAELEKREMCQVRGDGQVEMKCSWEDLRAVLRTVGLLKLPSHKKGKK